MKKKVRILSIEGGGILGLSSIILMEEIEKRLSDRLKSPIFLSDYFDFIAGNSSGAIIAALFLLKNNAEKKFHVKDLTPIFIETLKSRDKLKDVFLFNHLKDLKTPCLFPAYEPERNWLNFFTQHNAKLHDSYDFYLKDVVSASSATPTHNPPVSMSSFSNGKVTEDLLKIIFYDNDEGVENIYGFLRDNQIIDNEGLLVHKMNQYELFYRLVLPEEYITRRYQISCVIDRVFNNRFKFIDGCVFANNPGLCSVIEVSKLKFPHRNNDYPTVSDVMLVSMGFRTRKNNPYSDILDEEFKNQMIDILFKSPQELTHFQLHYLFNSFNSLDSYFPLYPENNHMNAFAVNNQLFDLSNGNIQAIREATGHFISMNDAYVNQLVNCLLDSHLPD